MKLVVILTLKVPVDRVLRIASFHLRWVVVQNHIHRIPTDTHQALYSAAYGCFGENPPNAPCLTWFFGSSWKMLKTPASPSIHSNAL